MVVREHSSLLRFHSVEASIHKRKGNRRPRRGISCVNHGSKSPNSVPYVVETPSRKTISNANVCVNREGLPVGACGETRHLQSCPLIRGASSARGASGRKAGGFSRGTASSWPPRARHPAFACRREDLRSSQAPPRQKQMAASEGPLPRD